MNWLGPHWRPDCGRSSRSASPGPWSKASMELWVCSISPVARSSERTFVTGQCQLPSSLVPVTHCPRISGPVLLEGPTPPSSTLCASCFASYFSISVSLYRNSSLTVLILCVHLWLSHHLFFSRYLFSWVPFSRIWDGICIHMYSLCTTLPLSKLFLCVFVSEDGT